MRDGLRTLTELVDRIEGEEVVVEDVSISRVEDGELTADFAVAFPDDAETASTPTGDADADDERLYRGSPGPTRDSSEEGATAESEHDAAVQPEADGDTGVVPPGFGALSARVGGPVAGSIADALADVDRREDGGPVPDDGNREDGRPPGAREDEPETGQGGSSNDVSTTCRVDGCDETFATEHGMKIHATKAHQSADGSAPSPHRNPERLGEVYETCDTFEEMTEALDVDVTPQTVRRSMMRLGVHDPTDDDGEATGDEDDRPGDDRPSEDADEGPDDDPATGTTEPADPEAATSVDVDELLPAAVDGDAFVAAVREATTLYEVQRGLDMGREEVQNLLAEFGLLDLVHGRVATKHEREDRKAEIERRIVDRAGEDGRRERSDEQREDSASDGPGEPANAD